MADKSLCEQDLGKDGVIVLYSAGVGFSETLWEGEIWGDDVVEVLLRLLETQDWVSSSSGWNIGLGDLRSVLIDILVQLV
jgi:hypothetical protein